MAYRGIDVSNHNGTINWSAAKNEIDFVMIRAGYSQTVDMQFVNNITACNNLGINAGIYWFSYALSVSDALAEAQKCVQTIAGYNITWPVAFDWEYDSDTYYTNQTGTTLSNAMRVEFAKTFLNYIKSQGYIAMNYTNPDYLNNKGFGDIINDYELWLAQWGVSAPSYTCGIWQTGTTTVSGISGDVDANVGYTDYSGVTPDPGPGPGPTPGPTPTSSSKMPLWMMLKRQIY